MDPAFIAIGRRGHGELVFGVVNAAPDLTYSATVVVFTFEGSDEGDEISGAGSADLLDDGSLEVEISFHRGDDAVLTAERDPASTACCRGFQIVRVPDLDAKARRAATAHPASTSTAPARPAYLATST